MIHVCFGLYDADGKYSKFVGTTMASIFENTSAAVTIHILHDNTLTADNRQKFSELAKKYTQIVELHNVEELCSDKVNFLREKLAVHVKSRFSIGAFYRLLIKNIFKGGRVIYLDADIIVNLDIAELWQQNLHGYPMAAVPEIMATYNQMIEDKFLLRTKLVKVENYFNSGVMIFDLDKLAEEFFYYGVQFLADNPACESVDQDILNAFFSENYFKLAHKFNSFINTEKNSLAKRIYHYAGHNIGINSNNPCDRLFLENFARTPWFNLDVIYNLGEEIRKTSDEFIRQMQWLMKIDIVRRRVFFCTAKNLPAILALFGQRNDDLFIEIKRMGAELIPASFNELVEKMTACRGQMMFFIFDLNYPAIMLELIKMGFREYQDFVNGLLFMTRGQCGEIRPEYNFIKAM